MNQRLRICCPETVNALILIPHHKQISVSSRQKLYHIMLYFRGILGFIHTKILVFLFEIRKHLRILFQYFYGIHHLVVIINPLPLP